MNGAKGEGVKTRFRLNCFAKSGLTWVTGLHGSKWLFIKVRANVSSTSIFLAGLAALLLGFALPAAQGQTGQWSWVSGSSSDNQAGMYGTLGTPAATNVPGSRRYASNWIDGSGNLWLFGGDGYDSTGAENNLNDLWEFISSAKQWVWMGGDNVVPCGPTGCTNYAGVYGTLKTPAGANYPGARYGATSWTDKNGNLWLFGGTCYDANGNDGWCNDLWMYSPATKQWTWVSGSKTMTCIWALGGYCAGTISYGTLGKADANNLPPGRMGAVGWTDSKGNLWLFGGETMVEDGVDSYLNDLWMFNPTTDEWTWMGGDSATPCSGAGCDGSSGVYGTMGTPDPANLPGARWFSSGWTDSSGNFWLFGGEGMVAGGGNLLNDLWKYDPSSGEWTWMGGSDSLYAIGGPNGVYGIKGTGAAGNVPGGRQYASSWTDGSGNFWLMGGLGLGASGGQGYLNDLWEFNPSSNEWTWVSGSNSANQIGIYGAVATSSLSTGSQSLWKPFSAPDVTTQGSSTSSDPGGRAYAQSWIDASGNLWLFGGQGYSSSGSGFLNDLWEFHTSATVGSGAFSLSASQESVSVQAGAHATVNLTVTPENGFSSAVNFACNGLPAGATCSFAPSSVTPSGAAVSTQMTIQTSSQSAAAHSSQRFLFPATALALVFCFAGLRRRRTLQIYLLLGIAAIGLGTLSGCGGGASSGSPSGTTSTVTVTATSGSAQQTVAIALTIH